MVNARGVLAHAPFLQNSEGPCRPELEARRLPLPERPPPPEVLGGEEEDAGEEEAEELPVDCTKPSNTNADTRPGYRYQRTARNNASVGGGWGEI